MFGLWMAVAGAEAPHSEARPAGISPLFEQRGTGVAGAFRPDRTVQNAKGGAQLRNTRKPSHKKLTHEDGNSIFSIAGTYDTGGVPNNGADLVAVGDFNGDHHADIAVTNYCADAQCQTSSVGVLLGNGDGTFQTAQIYPSTGGYVATSIAVGDVNGDGKADLVVSNQCAPYDPTCEGSVGVLLGNGDGTFQPVQIYDSGGRFAQWVAVGDLDHDGYDDVIVANLQDPEVNCGQYACGNVGVLRANPNGDGTLLPVQVYLSGGLSSEFVALKDLDGDGNQDVIATYVCSDDTCQNGLVEVMPGDGHGTFKTPHTYQTGPYACVGAVGDVNNDGRLDVIVSTGCYDTASYYVEVLLGRPDGTLQTPIATQHQPAGWDQVTVGDFDLDGNLDYAIPAAIELLLGNGDGTFHDSSLPAGGGGIATGDFNEDGKPDLAVDISDKVTVLLNVVNTATTTMLTSSANPAAKNQTVTYTATVTGQHGGTPTGTVTFNDGTTAIATVPLSGSAASFSTSYAALGTHSMTAVYSGDARNLGSTSDVLTEYIKTLPVPSTTTVTSSLNPSLVGQPVTFTAAVASAFGNIPDGELVTFLDGTAQVGTGLTSGGAATFTTSALSAKTHTIKAKYAGDASFKASSGTVKQTVNLYPTTTALTSAPNPSNVGQVVTFTATVTTTAPTQATGNVSFKDGTKIIGTATVDANGVATLNKKISTAGSHSITATYNGDSLSGKSTSNVVVQVVN